jgi:DNA-binding Xre family transcriptional regulator
METLAAICRHLQCQPGDILEYIEEGGKKDDEND